MEQRADTIEKQRKLAEVLNDLIFKKFYGKITLTFRDGRVVHIEKNESIKVD